MHPDIPGISDGNGSIPDGIADLHAEIHESLRILRALEPVLPLLTEALPDLQRALMAFRGTNGGSIGVLRAGRKLRNGG